MVKAHRTDLFLIVIIILGLNLILIRPFPIIYGGDTIIRLVNFSKILIAYQLPLFQILIHYAMTWFHHPLAIWLLMGILSGSAGAGLYSLSLVLTGDRAAARLAALFYAIHPFIIYYSRVPYQEPLLLACVTWGLYHLFKDGSRRGLFLSSVLLGAGCLTRYEGWIAAAVAFVFHAWRLRGQSKRFRIADMLRSLALFGWAPAVWLIWNRGISPEGTFVLQMDFDWDRFYRPYFIARTSVWWSGPAITLLALLGFAATAAQSKSTPSRAAHGSLTLLLALFFTGLVFSAHGIEPDPVRFVTEREAFLPIGILLLYGGIGAARLGRRVSDEFIAAPRLRRIVFGAALLFLSGLGVYQGVTRIAQANADPKLLTDYEVARFLAEAGASAVVLARPLPDDQIQAYLQRAGHAGGEKGSRRALDLLIEVETSPFDYQRVLVFSWLGRDRILPARVLRGLRGPEILSFLHERGVDYLVVFSDFMPSEEHEQDLLSLHGPEQIPALAVQHGDEGARIFRLQD